MRFKLSPKQVGHWRRLLFFLILASMVAIGLSFFLWDFHLLSIRIRGSAEQAIWILRSRYGIAEGFVVGAGLVAVFSILPLSRLDRRGHWAFGLLALPFFVLFEFMALLVSTAFSAGGIAGPKGLVAVNQLLGNPLAWFNALDFLGMGNFGKEALPVLLVGLTFWGLYRGFGSALAVASYAVLGLGLMLLCLIGWTCPCMQPTSPLGSIKGSISSPTGSC